LSDAPTGWLAFYLPSHPLVVQLNERYRWLNEPPPQPSLFDSPLLYVTELRNDQSAILKLAHELGLRVHGHIPHGMRPLDACTISD
jgi:hypothetical protein